MCADTFLLHCMHCLRSTTNRSASRRRGTPRDTSHAARKPTWRHLLAANKHPSRTWRSATRTQTTCTAYRHRTPG
eukprot:6006905-Alexandrium_andersonii.AAC.1